MTPKIVVCIATHINCALRLNFLKLALVNLAQQTSAPDAVYIAASIRVNDPHISVLTELLEQSNTITHYNITLGQKTQFEHLRDICAKITSRCLGNCAKINCDGCHDNAHETYIMFHDDDDLYALNRVEYFRQWLGSSRTDIYSDKYAWIYADYEQTGEISDITGVDFANIVIRAPLFAQFFDSAEYLTAVRRTTGSARHFIDGDFVAWAKQQGIHYLDATLYLYRQVEEEIGSPNGVSHYHEWVGEKFMITSPHGPPALSPSYHLQCHHP